MNKFTSSGKYVVTLAMMFTLGYILYTFKSDSVERIRNEVNKIEAKLDTLKKSNLGNYNLKEDQTQLQELIIDKYIDYSSFLVTGVSMIMTIMILFTFRDFERLDQLKEQYIDKIKEFDSKKIEFDDKINNFDIKTSEIQEKIDKQFNEKKQLLEKAIEDKGKAFARLSKRNSAALVKEQEKIIDEQNKIIMLSDNINLQIDFVNELIESIGTQGFEIMAQILKTKEIIDKVEYRNSILSIAYVSIGSPKYDVRMRAVYKIRSQGFINSVPFLKERLIIETDSTIRKAIIDAIEDLINRNSSL